jgi:hypothetical protein
MVKMYHGTNQDNYKEILKKGLKKGSWATTEYKDAKLFAEEKAKGGRWEVISFEVPYNLFEEILKEEHTFEVRVGLIIWHFTTKKDLSKKFLMFGGRGDGL